MSGSITGVTESSSENSAKMASTSWVRNYVATNSGSISSTKTLESFTATAGQTSFTITNGYTPGLLDIYLNGSFLNTSEYTATDGSTLVLTNAASLDDVIDVVKTNAFYVGASPNARESYLYTATASQTTFAATYTPGQVDVFYNGSKLAPAEFTATNGTSVVLTTAATSGDVVEIMGWLTGGGLTGTRTLTINGVTYDLSANRSWTIPTGVTSFNTRTGAVTLLSGDVTGALGYTPYNATNPSGYITASALSSYLPLSGGTLTGALSGTSATFSAGTTSSFGFGVTQNSTFPFGSTNGNRIAAFTYNSGDGNGIQIGYDTAAGTGIIAGGTNVSGAGIDFYTYNGSAWASRMRVTKDGNVGIGTTSNIDQKLTVNGRIRVSPDGNNGGDMAVNDGGLAFSTIGATPIQFWTNNYSTQTFKVASNGDIYANNNAALFFGASALTYLAGGNTSMTLAVNNATALSFNSSRAATFSSSVSASVIYSNTDFRTDGGTVKVGAGSNNYYTQLSTAYNYPYVDSYLDSVAGASYEGRLQLRTSTAGGSLVTKVIVYNNGQVGIGTTSPNGSAKLDVAGNIMSSGSSTILMLNNTGGTAQSWWVGQDTAGNNDGIFYIYNATSSSQAINIRKNNNVIVGMTTDTGNKFTVNGNIVAYGSTGGLNILGTYHTGNSTQYAWFNSGNGGMTLTHSGVANVGTFNMSTGVYTTTSDLNKKKDIEVSSLGLNEVLQLIPKTYRFKTEAENSKKSIGFIAQEVKNIIPNAYSETVIDSEVFIGLEYTSFIPVLVKAVQELKAENDQLKDILTRNNII